MRGICRAMTRPAPVIVATLLLTACGIFQPDDHRPWISYYRASDIVLEDIEITQQGLVTRRTRSPVLHLRLTRAAHDSILARLHGLGNLAGRNFPENQVMDAPETTILMREGPWEGEIRLSEPWLYYHPDDPATEVLTRVVQTFEELDHHVRDHGTP